MTCPPPLILKITKMTIYLHYNLKIKHFANRYCTSPVCMTVSTEETCMRRLKGRKETGGFEKSFRKDGPLSCDQHLSVTLLLFQVIVETPTREPVTHRLRQSSAANQRRNLLKCLMGLFFLLRTFGICTSAASLLKQSLHTGVMTDRFLFWGRLLRL